MDKTDGELMLSEKLGFGQKMEVAADRSATYEVVCADGTRVEFSILAGQSFSVTAGTGSVNIHLKSMADHGSGPRLVEP